MNHWVLDFFSILSCLLDGKPYYFNPAHSRNNKFHVFLVKLLLHLAKSNPPSGECHHHSSPHFEETHFLPVLLDPARPSWAHFPRSRPQAWLSSAPGKVHLETPQTRLQQGLSDLVGRLLRSHLERGGQVSSTFHNVKPGLINHSLLTRGILPQ